MILNIIKKSSAVILILAVFTGFTACNGDMHDDDESLKSYIVYSLQDKTLSVPKGAIFNESFEAYSIEGTYGEYKFSYIKITVDGYYDSTMVLKDSNGNQVGETFHSGQSVFTLEYDMTIKIGASSVFPLDKWNNIKYQ